MRGLIGEGRGIDVNFTIAIPLPSREDNIHQKLEQKRKIKVTSPNIQSASFFYKRAL